MTSAIETLVLQIEAQANSTKSVYATMQKLLKELRDKHNVELGCALNKSGDVLKQECKRIATAFRNGYVQEQEPKEKKQAKAKAAKATTHTSAKVETTVAPSEPKQVGLELQLAEARAEIERLRRELADKTNEVAEYSEALKHANDTIKKQHERIYYLEQTMKLSDEPGVVTLVDNFKQEPVEDEPELNEEPIITTDAVDDLVLMIKEGNRDVAVAIIKKLADRLGNKRGSEFIEGIKAISYLSATEVTQGIRNLMTTHNLKMDWLETAMTIETAARL